MATLLIHAIECVAVSDSSLTPEAKGAINTTIDFAASIATVAGGYGAIVAGALQAGKAIFNAVGDIGSAPDQLYLSLSNHPREKKIWPLVSENYAIDSGQRILELSSRSMVIHMPIPVTIPVPMVGPLKVVFQNTIDINFWEQDVGTDNDDFLGRLSVNEAALGRMLSQVVGSAEQGSLYVVAYSVEAPRWVSLGGVIDGEPAAVTTLDGHLAVFGRGSDNSIWWKKQVNANGDWSVDWRSLGTPPAGILGSPAVALNAVGAMVVFVQGGDNAIWHRWQTSRNSQTWSDWVSLGGNVTSAPGAVLDKNGCLVVFARGTDNAIWQRWQIRPNQEWSSQWHSLGGATVGTPVATLNVEKQVVVFARGPDNAIWQRWQTRPYTPPSAITLPEREQYGSWVGTWESLGGNVSSAPAACLNADGGLVVFARGLDNSVWHRWQTSRNGEWSRTWESLYGDVSSAPSASLYQDGRLVAFARGTDSAVWYRWQTSRNGSWF